jgi:hypothetical protein
MTAHTIQARRAELCRENSRRDFFAPLTACVRTPRWNCFRGATMRRRLFIQALMDVERIPADEAVELLKDYDSITGRFQWDLRRWKPKTNERGCPNYQ